jgi:hypothetical protein
MLFKVGFGLGLLCAKKMFLRIGHRGTESTEDGKLRRYDNQD